jgi:acetyl-CoA C-acetyltransferase
MQMNKIPVVIGIADIQQKGKFDDLDEALLLMDKATKAAINDSSNEIINYIDEIRTPKGFWNYKDPGKWIAQNNNFRTNPVTYVTKIGILQQSLFNDAIKSIQNGKVDASLIVGGESRYKLIRSFKENKDYKETPLTSDPDYYLKAESDLYLEEEIKQLSEMPVGFYAIIENAYRFNKKLSISDHQDALSNLYAEFSKIAANNKYAWSNTIFKSSDIKKASSNNKYQAFPYNKYHCTSWNVNQASATIICDESIANKLKIPRHKRVYPLASSENNNMISLIQRPYLSSYAGMNLAADFIKNIQMKLKKSINLFDLYSCFPIAIEMFADSLQMPITNKCTITGGMPFAGGPLNHYVLTSTNQMIRELRNNPQQIGLVTGVSGIMTKQSYALWSGSFIEKFKHKDVTSEAAKIEKPVKLSSKKSGVAKIISFTILEEKINCKKAIIYGEAYKERIILSTKDKIKIRDMETNEWIGKEVKFKNGLLI